MRTGERSVVPSLVSLSQDYMADSAIVFSDARARCPVFHEEAIGGWVVTRYDDARIAMSEWETFSSRVLRSAPLPPDRFDDALPTDLIGANVLNLDPPRHTATRKVMQKLFTVKAVAVHEPRIRAIAHRLIDAMEASSAPRDLIRDFADPLMWFVTSQMIGLPESDAEQFESWRASFVALLADARGADRAPNVTEARWDHLAEAWAYLRELIETRRRDPREDLVSLMLGTVDDRGAPCFSDDEIVLQTLGLATAANDTTANLIATVVFLLARNATLADALAGDPAVMATVIEEALRRYPSALQVYRVTTRAAELGGVTIPAGAMVSISVPSACNDETRFEGAPHVNLNRPNLSEHLAFGIGRHKCLGAPAARLVTRVALETLYARLPALRVPEQEVMFELNRVIRCHRALAVEW